MKRIMKNTLLLVVVVCAATACTRRVQVESEPSQPEYPQAPGAVDGAAD